MKNIIISIVMLISTGVFAQTSSVSSDSKSVNESYYFDVATVFVGMHSLVLVDSALIACMELIKEHFTITENFPKNISDNNTVKCNEKNKEKVQTK